LALIPGAGLTGVTIVHVLRPCEGIESVSFAELAATAVTADVEASIAKIAPETVGKLLFTSGSTGMPKANTMKSHKDSRLYFTFDENWIHMFDQVTERSLLCQGETK